MLIPVWERVRGREKRADGEVWALSGAWKSVVSAGQRTGDGRDTCERMAGVVADGGDGVVVFEARSQGQRRSCVSAPMSQLFMRARADDVTRARFLLSAQPVFS